MDVLRGSKTQGKRTHQLKHHYLCNHAFGPDKSKDQNLQHCSRERSEGLNDEFEVQTRVTVADRLSSPRVDNDEVRFP